MEGSAELVETSAGDAPHSKMGREAAVRLDMQKLRVLEHTCSPQAQVSRGDVGEGAEPALRPDRRGILVGLAVAHAAQVGYAGSVVGEAAAAAVEGEVRTLRRETPRPCSPIAPAGRLEPLHRHRIHRSRT